MMLRFFVEIALWWWWRCCTTSSWALKSCAIPSRKALSNEAMCMHADERGKNLLFSLSLFHLCNIKKCIQLCAEHSGWEICSRCQSSQHALQLSLSIESRDRNLFGVKLCQLLRISGDRYGLIDRATDSCTWWRRVIEFFLFRLFDDIISNFWMVIYRWFCQKNVGTLKRHIIQFHDEFSVPSVSWKLCNILCAKRRNARSESAAYGAVWL